MSTTTSIRNKATTLAHVQAIIGGTQKYFPNGSFQIGNATYTTASLVQALKVLEDALSGLAAAHSSVKDAVTALRAAETTVTPLLRGYRTFVRVAFGTAAAQLADFGLQPPKARKPLDSDKRVVAKAKMKATRTARGTTSKKQKLAVKGDVTGVLVTPVKSAGPSSPTAAPAELASTATAPPTGTAAPK
jgi:hypothetical protein